MVKDAMESVYMAGISFKSPAMSEYINCNHNYLI